MISNYFWYLYHDNFSFIYFFKYEKVVRYYDDFNFIFFSSKTIVKYMMTLIFSILIEKSFS